MKRYDLRLHKSDFFARLGEILDGFESGEVGIFLFEVGDFGNVAKSAEFVKERGFTLMNSLRFNEVDWTIVVKKPTIAESRSLKALESLESTFASITQDSAPPALNQYDYIITLGAYAKNLKSNVCFSPFCDTETNLYVRYEVGAEEGVAALFLYEFYKGDDAQIAQFVKDLDYGYLTSETNISEEEIKSVKSALNAAQKPLLVIGSDLYLHKQARNILLMLSLLDIDIFVLHANGNDMRVLQKPQGTLESPREIGENNGCVVYAEYAPSGDSTLKISKEFARAWNLSDNIKVAIRIDDVEIEAVCVMDEHFGGIIGILKSAQFFGYPYKRAAIKRVL